MDLSFGTFVTTYTNDDLVIITSFPFSITCFVGSIEDFAVYDFFFSIKGSINYRISKSFSSRSIEILFDDFSGSYNGHYSCGAGDELLPDITLTLYYNGSGLFNLKHATILFGTTCAGLLRS